jgi:hypothetical protein
MANPHRLEPSDLLAQGSADVRLRSSRCGPHAKGNRVILQPGPASARRAWTLVLQRRGIRNRGKGVKSSSLTVLDDLFRRVLSALGGVLGAVGPVARESAAVGGDKGIDVVLQLPDAR